VLAQRARAHGLRERARSPANNRIRRVRTTAVRLPRRWPRWRGFTADRGKLSDGEGVESLEGSRGGSKAQRTGPAGYPPPAAVASLIHCARADDRRQLRRGMVADTLEGFKNSGFALASAVCARYVEYVLATLPRSKDRRAHFQSGMEYQLELERSCEENPRRSLDGGQTPSVPKGG
jgi:hypothetical protein